MINKSFCIYIVMVKFYNSQNIEIEFSYDYPCNTDELSISGLKEGELLVSYNPSYIQNSNGLLVGIDSRFTDFYVLNEEKLIIQNRKLNWITNCNISVQETSELHHNNSILITFIIIILILTIITITRRKYESN